MDDRFDNRRYYNEDTFGIQSTAGAVPIKNKKGEISMQKVKVQRYISGKRPDYAARSDSESESEEDSDEDFTEQQQRRPRAHGHSHRRQHDSDEEDMEDQEEGAEFARRDDLVKQEQDPMQDSSDPRIRRLMAAKQSNEVDNEDEDRVSRHRRLHQPEVLSDGSDEEEEESDESTTDDEDLDEDALLRRRDLMRQRALAKAQIGQGPDEIMDKEEEKSGAEESEEEESSEEDTTDSEEEENARLKPVFVRKKDRLTVQEKEREEAKERVAEREAQAKAEHRRKETLRIVETMVKEDVIDRKSKDSDPLGLNEVNTDDENEEVEYEAWKLRELKRLKRDREEKETREREQAEAERLRNMTEDERRAELKNNPKIITNKASKGKYKFLQKYYHRGAFFMEAEENVYKRDYSMPTLEDRFDKTVLPKVMQVKNFGRSGRTKYTHLVDQDTTQFDASWSQETAQNLKFQLQHAGGMKPVFEKPSSKKKN